MPFFPLRAYVSGMPEARAGSGAVGKVLLDTRLAAGLNQAELASLAGVDPGYLSKVEAGKRIPSRYWIDMVQRAATDALTARKGA